QADMVTQRQARLKPKNARPPRSCQAYIGLYSSPIMGEISIKEVDDGHLAFLLGPYKIPVRLTHCSGDVFFATVPLPSYSGEPSHVDQLKVQFVANDNDEVVGMRWLAMGYSITTFCEIGRASCRERVDL